MVLRWKDYPGICRYTLNVITSVLKRKGKAKKDFITEMTMEERVHKPENIGSPEVRKDMERILS